MLLLIIVPFYCLATAIGPSKPAFGFITTIDEPSIPVCTLKLWSSDNVANKWSVFLPIQWGAVKPDKPNIVFGLIAYGS